MRKCIALFLCTCSLCVLSITASAADVFDYTMDDWKALYSIPEPHYEDFEDSGGYAIAWNTWYTGFSNFIIQETQTEHARQAETVRHELESKISAEDTSPKSSESAGLTDGVNTSSLENNDIAKYPLGSYVDPFGIVWSPDGTRLSPDLSENGVPAANPEQSSDLPSPQAVDPVYSSAAEEPDVLAMIARKVSDIAADQPVWYVEDLRPSDAPAEVLDGLKSLVTSIFGEYTPVTTTSIITETVGNDTRQYLVETVASGAAGVDYEWLAGVFLFGILLFCFMKLLGGVLK